MVPKRSSSRVLVIDDSESARLAIRAELSGAGFDVYSLPSAIGATRMLVRRSIDAVVIDLGMPGLSGDLLVGLLRRNPRLRSLVIVVVSGEREEELERVAREIDVDAVLAKDRIPMELSGLIAELLRSRRLGTVVRSS